MLTEINSNDIRINGNKKGIETIVKSTSRDVSTGSSFYANLICSEARILLVLG